MVSSSVVSTRGQAQGLLAKVEADGGSGEESTTSVNVGVGVDIGVNIVDSVDAEAIRLGTKPDTSSMYLARGRMVRTGQVDMGEGRSTRQ